jgi:hemerythrin-like domain-containing protein
MSLRPSRKAPAYTAHSAVANPPSGTDLLQRLTYEHREFRKLWEDMQRAHIRDRGQGHAVDDARLGDSNQFDLSQQILEALAEHEALELELLYPVAAGVMNDDWADHARDQHAEVRSQLESIEGKDPEDERVYEIFSSAVTRIVAHMDEEDKVLFPIMRLVLPPEALMVDRHAVKIKHVPPPPKLDDEVYVDITDRQLAAGAHGGEHELETAGNGSGDEIRLSDEHESAEANGDEEGDGNGRNGRSLRVLRRR